MLNAMNSASPIANREFHFGVNFKEDLDIKNDADRILFENKISKLENEFEITITYKLADDIYDLISKSAIDGLNNSAINTYFEGNNVDGYSLNESLIKNLIDPRFRLMLVNKEYEEHDLSDNEYLNSYGCRWYW